MGNLHATLVAVAGQGVLILGPARAGKSALALCLLRLARREGLAAALVSDDQVLMETRGNTLWGVAPTAIAGLLEVSGTGILRQAFVPESPVALAVTLAAEPPRLPDEPTRIITGTAVRHIYLPVRAATLGAEIILSVLQAD